MNNVFVTGIGRCGTYSFMKACEFFTNYNTGHETPTSRFEYGDDWIEVSPHIRHCIREIVVKYPEAKWIHLLREREDNVVSLMNLEEGKIMMCYRELRPSSIIPDTLRNTAEIYYRDENRIIEDQLKLYVPPVNQMQMKLDSIKPQWKSFMEFVGAEGSFEDSVNSWNTPYNTTAQRRGEE